jgi:hypothetical protein
MSQVNHRGRSLSLPRVVGVRLAFFVVHAEEGTERETSVIKL